jgi:hypothetical protein
MEISEIFTRALPRLALTDAGLVTLGCYYWLKPKLGTWGAVAASGVIGTVAAIGLLAMIRS